MRIQQELIDKIAAGQCVIFLGAGASMEAKAPSASQLAQELNEKFLQGKYANDNLSKISSYIETKPGVGRAHVIEYIINNLLTLEPSDGHLLIPEFNWASIYTTNYDTLIEKAYSMANINYRPIIFNSDLSIICTEKTNTQLIYKPHGCISRPDSIVLTEDDYYKFTEDRTAIFRQLENHKYKNTFLFIGYSFSDFNLSKIWYDIRKEAGDLFQWSYALWPNHTEEEKNLWQSRNVILIDAKFSEFMIELKKSIAKDIINVIGKNDTIDSTVDIVRALLLCMEMRDAYYKKHSILVSTVSGEIAKELQLSPDSQNNIRTAAMLHDIGIIKIPDSVLYKSRPLTLPEFELLKQHPIIGEQTVSTFPSLKHLSKIIRYHHERFDGRGYPDGIKQNEIPIESRIIIVADAFVSMSIDRPYRKAMSTNDAVEQINSDSGKCFDPQVVEAFNVAYSKGLITKIVYNNNN